MIVPTAKSIVLPLSHVLQPSIMEKKALSEFTVLGGKTPSSTPFQPEGNFIFELSNPNHRITVINFAQYEVVKQHTFTTLAIITIYPCLHLMEGIRQLKVSSTSSFVSKIKQFHFSFGQTESFTLFNLDDVC